MSKNFLERLNAAVEEDKTWSPKITMNLDTPNNPQDIIPYLQPSGVEKVLLKSKGYPKNASFQFSGYKGMEMKDDLIKELKSAALKDGTLLNFRSRGKMSKHRALTIEVTCGKHVLSRSTKTLYKDDCIQQSGTIIQPKHQGSSVKGASRSSKLKHVSYDDSMCVSTESFKKRMTSSRPTEFEHKCPFMFYVFLSSEDNNWYLSSFSKSTNRMFHKHHFRLPEHTVCHHYSDLSQPIKDFIHKSIATNLHGPDIVNMVKSLHGINITTKAINTARVEYTRIILKEYCIDVANSSCDKLLDYFRANKDISFLSVTHSVHSGFVTHRRTKNPQNDMVISETKHDVEATTISEDDVDSWRSHLKVNDGKEILVALAWVHEEDMRNVTLFPEFLSVDVTFGVNKQRRNLLRVCGIDGIFKVFTAFNCFMPSKQFRAFDWVCRVAFPKLVGKETLRFNSIVTSDQESPLTSGIRSMMDSRENPLGRSCHRLDMFHIFVKEWKDKVSYL